MALFKENGSLDVEWIDNLPIEEFTKVYFRLTREQEEEFWNKVPGPTKAVVVDYTFEDEIKRGTMVDAVEFLNQQREKYGTKRQDDTHEK